MTKLKALLTLNAALLKEMPQYASQSQLFGDDYTEQRRLLRSLMNVRPPAPIDDAFLALQDVFLQEEAKERGIVHLSDLVPTKMPTKTPIKKHGQLYIWQGDITRLAVDAIVNAANSALLGCFVPSHACIDNAIHSMAGLQLRNECHEIMQKQGHKERTGEAKITKAYNLPSKYVIHTVGPIVHGELTKKDCKELENSYRSCLELATDNNLQSLAFCCISTGEFCFPNKEAADIAVKTVLAFLQEKQSTMQVIFNVFKDIDYTIYKGLLEDD